MGRRKWFRSAIVSETKEACTSSASVLRLERQRELNITVNTPELSVHIHRVVWHMEVVTLLPTQSVVEITLVVVVRAPWVASSVVRSYIHEGVSKEQASR